VKTKKCNEWQNPHHLYQDFTQSQYFCNLTKHDKQKYNKTYFSKYIESNTFFKKYYIDRLENVRSIVCQWKKIKDDDDDDDDEIDNFLE